MSPETRRAIFWPTVLTALATLFLIGLGTWQLDRKAWKEALIERIEQRSKASPMVLDAAATLLQSGDDLEYTRLRARGRLRTDRSQFLFQAQGTMAGFHVYTPLETPSGKILMVNRGFVPEAVLRQLDTGNTDWARTVEIIGYLRKPGRKATFDGQNDPHRNRWYWRDLDGMLRAAVPDRVDQAYPFFLEAETAPAGQPVSLAQPQGGVTRVHLPNRHLEYAMTWYGFALTLLGVYAFFVRAQVASFRHGRGPQHRA